MHFLNKHTYSCLKLKQFPPGVFLLAILSIMINLGFMVFPTYALSHIDSDGLSAWLMMLLIADIWMGVGARTGKRVLLVPWLVLYMIYILICFVTAPLLLYSATYAVKEARQM